MNEERRIVEVTARDIMEFAAEYMVLEDAIAASERFAKSLRVTPEETMVVLEEEVLPYDDAMNELARRNEKLEQYTEALLRAELGNERVNRLSADQFAEAMEDRQQALLYNTLNMLGEEEIGRVYLAERAIPYFAAETLRAQAEAQHSPFAVSQFNEAHAALISVVARDLTLNNPELKDRTMDHSVRLVVKAALSEAANQLTGRKETPDWPGKA